MNEKELLFAWDQLCYDAKEMSFAKFQNRIRSIGDKDPKMKDLVLDGLLSNYPARNAATKILLQAESQEDISYLIANASKIRYDSACTQMARNVRFFMGR